MNINPDIKQRILDTAETLVAEGVGEPTNAAVLERMGRGSLSHVSPVMREWRASRKAQDKAALEMPTELKKSLDTALARMWSMASTLASAAVEHVRQEAVESVEAVEHERDEALKEVERLESQCAELENTLTAKDKAIAKHKDSAEKERQTMHDMAIEATRLTALADERKALINRLTTELTEARKEAKNLQTELVKIAKSSKK